MRNIWTKPELKILVELYPNVLTRELAIKLKRSVSSVYGQARKLGLSKSDTFFKSENSGRSNVIKNQGQRFQPGHIPANKGKKMSAELKEKVKHTFFKPGNLPHNTKSDGIITIRKDNRGVPYQFIRISLGNWRPLHHNVWIKENGGIPKGMLVIFIDGNTMNVSIDNLMMISKADNMKSNSLYNYPKEIQDAFKTIGRLTKEINKHERRNRSKR